MTIANIINGLQEGVTNKVAQEAVENYAKSRSNTAILEELKVVKGKSRKTLSDNIQRYNLEFLLFKLATGITAQEQITQNGTNKTLGCNSLIVLAHILYGEPLKKDEIGVYFRLLSKQNNLPLLTEEHQQYIDKFDLEHVLSTPLKQLKQEITIGMGHSPIPDTPSYSPFLYEFSKKISGDKRLQYELFKKWTGITAQEQITQSGYKKIPGAMSLRGITSLLTGENMRQQDVKKILMIIAKQNNMPLLTEEHGEYIKNFNLEYVIKTSRKNLIKELQIGKHLSTNPSFYKHSQYSPFMHQIFRKVTQDKGLEYELFKKIIGITAQEQIIQHGYRGLYYIPYLPSIITRLTGKQLKKTNVRKFLKKLANKYNMPLLTEEHQEYIKGFNVEYVRKTTKGQLYRELPLKRGFSLQEDSHRYSPFLHELSKKISLDNELQLEVFKKWTGITTKEQITNRGYGRMLGYYYLIGLAEILTGKRMRSSERGAYFRSLF